MCDDNRQSLVLEIESAMNSKNIPSFLYDGKTVTFDSDGYLKYGDVFAKNLPEVKLKNILSEIRPYQVKEETFELLRQMTDVSKYKEDSWAKASIFPAGYKDVLVCNINKEIFIASYHPECDCWYSNDYQKNLNITHWMELPDAPEEK